jgi:hypothetical protein
MLYEKTLIQNSHIYTYVFSSLYVKSALPHDIKPLLDSRYKQTLFLLFYLLSRKVCSKSSQSCRLFPEIQAPQCKRSPEYANRTANITPTILRKLKFPTLPCRQESRTYIIGGHTHTSIREFASDFPSRGSEVTLFKRVGSTTLMITNRPGKTVKFF